MKVKYKQMFLLIKLMVLIAGALIFSRTAYAQTNPVTKVSRISSETEDSIVFQISVAKTIFARGEDIYVNYVVQNKSKKSIYLVVEPSPKVLVKEIWLLELIQPVKGYDDHDPYEYDLIKIRPQKTYEGKLIIKAESYLQNAKYTFEETAIQAGFSYLFDASNLSGCKKTEYKLPCLRELYDKSKSLTIGNLVVEIKQI